MVPIVSQAEYDDKTILVAAGEPLDFSDMDKDSALKTLRDELSTLRYDLCKDYPPLRRAELTGDVHYRHMLNRRDTYLEVNWVEPNWAEEMMTRKTDKTTPPQDVFAPLERVKITPHNAWILAPILFRNQEYRRYDLIDFMNRHWNDKTSKS